MKKLQIDADLMIMASVSLALFVEVAILFLAYAEIIKAG